MHPRWHQHDDSCFSLLLGSWSTRSTTLILSHVPLINIWDDILFIVPLDTLLLITLKWYLWSTYDITRWNRSNGCWVVWSLQLWFWTYNQRGKWSQIFLRSRAWQIYRPAGVQLSLKLLKKQETVRIIKTLEMVSRSSFRAWERGVKYNEGTHCWGRHFGELNSFL